MQSFNRLCIVLVIRLVSSWAFVNTNIKHRLDRIATRRSIVFASTPFEADLYLDDDDDDDEPLSSLAVPPDTQLVLGINKYSHDTALCAADAVTGRVLWAASKERLTRKKHDSGNVAKLTDACLEALNLSLDSVATVVVNNHHHRVLPIEANRHHLEWECGLTINGGMEDGYDDDENLFPAAKSMIELSHHLAHAYSAAAQAPFDTGLVVVMDGMGETYRTMQLAVEQGDASYVSDLSFGSECFSCVPSNIAELAQTSRFDWREAESVYRFSKQYNDKAMDLRPIFKRFTAEHSPPVLYNHGFENMDSIGALYSRASSHIFGDWNSCGKVMGLAPWMGHEWTTTAKRKETVSATLPEKPILQGNLCTDNGLIIDRTLLEGAPHISRYESDLFSDDGAPKKRYDFDDNESEEEKPRVPVQVALEAIGLAHRMQIDLENVAMDFCRHWKKETGETNLCLAGGVALNSVLNGRLARELDFERTFIPPYPGDDGIAVGCCAFALFGNVALEEKKVLQAPENRPPLWTAVARRRPSP